MPQVADTLIVLPPLRPPASGEASDDHFAGNIQGVGSVLTPSREGRKLYWVGLMAGFYTLVWVVERLMLTRWPYGQSPEIILADLFSFL